MYTPYVTPEEYRELGYSDIPEGEIDKYLARASHLVDALTLNRIVAKGYAQLTDFQKDIIQTVVCEQTEFMYVNNDMIEAMLSEYSINGVSAKFNTDVLYVNGIPFEAISAALLEQTGLCCRLAV